jgi:energy-coupling factor transporter transmembrane protein EcfT
MKELLKFLKSIKIKDLKDNPGALIFISLVLLVFLPNSNTPVNLIKIVVLSIVIFYALIIFAMKNESVKKIKDTLASSTVKSLSFFTSLFSNETTTGKNSPVIKNTNGDVKLEFNDKS